MKKRLPSLSKLWLVYYVYDGLGATWFVVSDPRAGRKSVYTVYRISLTGNKQAHVIGRELPLTTARAVVRKDMEAVR